MSRHSIAEPRVQAVVRRLAAQVVRLGSVNALADLLTAALPPDASRVYPNRLHGLLAQDPSRSVNSATLAAIEAALPALEAAPAGPDSTVRQRVLAAVAAAPNGADDPVAAVAEAVAVPRAVVEAVVGVRENHEAHRAPVRSTEPDWTWQDRAVDAALRTLRHRPGVRAGLVIPTGGGKTRIALRVALRWLADEERDDTVVIWVTHRRLLGLQARRALQQLLREDDGVPSRAAELFARRIEFVMVHDAAAAVERAGERLALVVVDEAHHAAAPTYRPLVEDVTAPSLFLTATPNRADALPIGIDEIAFTVTYRELFERRCLIEPTFDPPLDLGALDWSSAAGLRDLADYLVDRTEADFGKVLVVVSRRLNAETLYDAVLALLDTRPDHPLAADDVGYVHADRTSGGVRPPEFLDEFAARPKGILISTAQLVGEGYDDPTIDAVVVTYASESIAHLMQVAGRALRAAGGKSRAHVVQVRESPIEYHFEQRWLYQDISDQLRPALVDRTFGSPAELLSQVEELLDDHRVAPAVRERIRLDIAGSQASDLHLMLTGLPYFGAPDDFAADAEWGAVLVTPRERERFVRIFNDLSARTDDIKEHHAYLGRHLAPDGRSGSAWKSYVDLVAAVEYARRELSAVPYAGASSRPYRRGRSTTWLRYVSFRFRPTVPAELDAFLADAVNRTDVITTFLGNPPQWAAAVKVDLPAGGAIAYLLTDDQVTWLRAQRESLLELLRTAAPAESFGVVTTWGASLPAVPIPALVVAEIRQFTRGDDFARRCLSLQDEPLPGAGV